MNCLMKWAAAFGAALLVGSMPVVGLAAENRAFSGKTVEQLVASAEQRKAIAEQRKWEGIAKELDESFSKGITKTVGYGFVVYRDGRRVFEHCSGMARLKLEGKGENVSFTPEHRFRMASVSKQYTMYTLMQLAEQGRLDLEADASKYLGFKLRHPLFPDKPITVRMLASHTSGLRDGKVYSIPPSVSVAEFFHPDGRYYENGDHFSPKNEPPGEFFYYASLNYGLLGTIIEVITGERFDVYQQEHILRQLDIGGGYLVGNFAAADWERLGTAYRKYKLGGKWSLRGAWYPSIDDTANGQPPRDTVILENPYDDRKPLVCTLSDYRPGINATFFSPQGGLRMSLREMGNTLQLLLNDGQYKGKRILKKSSIDLMRSAHWHYDKDMSNGDTYGGCFTNYGLGLYRADIPGKERAGRNQAIKLVGHAGDAYGIFTGIFAVDGKKDGFAYIISGQTVETDEDPRSAGKFSGNYIWEEVIMDAICRGLVGKE